VTEGDVLQALRRRYGQRSGNGPQWAFIPHVRNAAGFGDWQTKGGLRTCDALALSLWPSKGLELHGHEIKCSRSDWLRERREPEKAEAFARFCDRWWLVAPMGVVRSPTEMPEGWGLLVLEGARGLVCKVPASKRTPSELPRTLIVAMTRAAIRGGSLGGE
jgi:hypothetical protein